ncbi:bifunctional glycosyltransferase/CDP-glycerol:glycerophosphate glycerophosphotransferase [Staphylococcus equorum]|uniref:bifunctional glycosyltransferase/CDP-glycerol:glycerophosphate glycerophosphotransferase n=1 Tax=Staphylococcus equorum TaxID=246432 RepID=UPI003EC11350
MKKLVVYGSFSSTKEVDEIVIHCRDEYKKIIIAYHIKSMIQADIENSHGIDLVLKYKNLSDLAIFETEDFQIISLNELLYERYDFKMSIVIPVYNTEQYIEETLESIIKQNMNLEDIQIILVNDGSTDNSEAILTKYRNRYPNNIYYINKQNEGVSIARNTGLKYVRGKYVNFLDSDDKWGLTTLKHVYNYFEMNPTLNVISTRLRFFDNIVGEHPLNFKYENKVNKVVDLKQDYDHIQMNVASVFFRTSAIKSVTFDTSLKYGEDAKFVYNVIKQTFKIGLMSYTQGCYWYRKRRDESSAIDKALSNPTFYSPTIEKFHNYLINDNRDNNIPKYVQMMILYDLQYRLSYQNITLSTLNSKQLEKYTNQIIQLLKRMDDDVISNAHLKQINAVYQIAILSVKYEGTNLNIKHENGEYKIYSNQIFIKNVSDMYLKTEYLYEKNKLLKCGYSLPNINMNIDVIPVAIINKEEIVRPVQESVITSQKFLNKNISYNKFYRFDISLNDDIKQIELKYLVNHSSLEKINQVSKTRHTNFSNTRIPFKQYANRTLRIEDNKKILNIKKKRFIIWKNILGLIKTKKTRKSAIYKIIGTINKKRSNGKVWLFVDRLDKAGDNAEALFDFVVKNKPDVKAYFLIYPSSPDFAKLREKYEDKIVAFNSKRHHILMFKTNKLFTSHSEAYLFNPFGGINGKFIRELLDFEFIFLQHGVIQNDLSTLLHKRNKPIDYFITSAEAEKREIIEKYGFSEQEVILSGLSRFDLLSHNKKSTEQVITVMPTWRPHLLEVSDKQFVESHFYKSIYAFLTHPKIQQIAKHKNNKINLCLHPRMQDRFSKFFKHITYINIPSHFSYKDIISNTNLLITDVSSIAFDIAYLRKPIIYYQFDIDEIYTYSVYTPGYFNYVQNGFGPVTYDVISLVKEVVKVRKNNFKMSKFYLRRSAMFFKYHDQNNRQRTIELISEQALRYKA